MLENPRRDQRLADRSRLSSLSCSAIDPNLICPGGDEVATVSAARRSAMPGTKAFISPRSFGCGCAVLRCIMRACAGNAENVRPRARLRAIGLCFLIAVGVLEEGWLIRAQRVSEWRVYRAADGLTESLTTAVTISPRGNVWVKHGEVDAVSYLDGYNVHHIPAPSEPNYRVYQSAAGRIWSIYAEGLLEYVDSRWQRYPIKELRWEVGMSPTRAIRPTPILPAEEDRVLLLLPDRFAEFRARTSELKVLRHASETSLGTFLDMTLAQDGGIWITGAEGIAKVPGRVRQINRDTQWREYVLPPDLAVRNLLRPFDDDDGGVTVVADDPSVNRRVLVHFDGTNWMSYSALKEGLRYAWRDTEPGKFWGLTMNSLLRIDTDSGRVEQVEHPGARFYDVAVQARGVFWLATLEGLYRYAPLAWRTPSGASGYSSVVYSVIEDSSGRLWFATADGLLEFDRRQWRRHAWPQNFDVSFRARDGLFNLKEGRLLISASEQVWVFDPHKDEFKPVAHPGGRRLRKVLRQLPDGVVCVQTAEAGAAPGQYDFELFNGNEFVRWEEAPPAIDLGSELFFLAATENGDLWLGGRSGPALWHEGKWQKFTAADGYDDEGALCFVEMPEGQIWCGGLGKISQYDGRNWAVVLSGLDRVSAMVRSVDWSVWAATGSGLYRYYKETWASVGEEEGLASSACYSLIEDRSRKLWVGTSRGVSQYFPRADPDAPRTTILEVTQTTQGANENVIAIGFRGQDKWRYTPERRLLYSCRLDGGSWSAFTPGTNAVYRDLASGKHKFEVRALDRNWNMELRPAAYQFDVVVPWYQEKRIVAVAIVGMTVALVFAAVAVNRHIRLMRSHAEVEKKVAERTQELERAMAALAHSEKMTALGTLAAGIAHDFNNMLSIIRGSAQIIEANINNPDKIRLRVERIKTVVDQASGIVKAMLGFGRAGDQPTSDCDVREVVENTIKLLGDRFLRETNVLQDIPDDLPRIRGSRDLLQQILLNLILNAADAIERDGQIVIRGQIVSNPASTKPVLAPADAPGYVLISVEDTGVGIPAELLQRVFEPFFTTKAFSARRGTGLGLYMVYQFARQMGHGLAVESEVGKGSKFTIIAPITSERA